MDTKTNVVLYLNGRYENPAEDSIPGIVIGHISSPNTKLDNSRDALYCFVWLKSVDPGRDEVLDGKMEKLLTYVNQQLHVVSDRADSCECRDVEMYKLTEFIDQLVGIYESDKKVVQSIYFISRPNQTDGFKNILKQLVNSLEQKVSIFNGIIHDSNLNYENRTFNLLLNSAIRISAILDSKTLETRKLLEYSVEESDKQLTTSLLNLGCECPLKKYIDKYDTKSITFILDLNSLNHQHLSNEKGIFHYIVLRYRYCPHHYEKLKRIFVRLANVYPANRLSKIFKKPSAEHRNLNLPEYAAYLQAPKMLDLILNFENGPRKTYENAIEYDVTNLIPETFADDDDDDDDCDVGKKITDRAKNDVNDNNHGDSTNLEMMTSFLQHSSSSSSSVAIPNASPQKPIPEPSLDPPISLVERIIATSADDERSSALLLNVSPMRFLISDYLLWSKCISAGLFAIQIIYMIAFTSFVMNQAMESRSAVSDSSASSNDSNGLSGEKNDSNSSKGTNSKAKLLVENFLWLIWPIITFVYSLIQTFGLNRLIAKANTDKKGCKLYVFANLSFYELTLITCFILWFALAATKGSRASSYFELTAVMLILGWLKPAYYLSYCQYWSAFVVALKSSMAKYLISFVFIFSFVYVGFSLALRLLLMKRYSSPEKDKPIDIVAYITFVTLFGMGELDSVPSEDNDDHDEYEMLMKVIVCFYCSSLAVLVLAIIRQPDEEVVVRVGCELTPRVNLKFVKNVAWLILLQKHLDHRRKLQHHHHRRQQKTDIESSYRRPKPGERYGSVKYELKKIFGFEPRVFKEIGHRYYLRLLKDDVIDVAMEAEGGDVIGGEEGDDGGTLENLRREVTRVQSSLEEVNRKMDVFLTGGVVAAGGNRV